MWTAPFPTPSAMLKGVVPPLPNLSDPAPLASVTALPWLRRRRKALNGAVLEGTRVTGAVWFAVMLIVKPGLESKLNTELVKSRLPGLSPLNVRVSPAPAEGPAAVTGDQLFVSPI